MKYRHWLGLVAVSMALSGCTTVRDWFRSDKDKAAAPIALEALPSALPVDTLWSRSLGDGEGKLGLRQKPATDGSRLYAINDEGELLAIGLADGKTVWSTEASPPGKGNGWRFWQREVIEGGLHGSPGVGDGLVVVVGRDGDVHALDADSGAEKWTARAPAEVLAAPLISNGVVVVRSQDGKLTAFDAVTGARRWGAESAVPSLGIRGAGAPIAAVGLVIAGFDDGKVRAFRAEDGQPIWEAVVAEPDGRTELDRVVDIDGELQAGADVVYATSAGGTTVAIALNSGQVLWNREDTGSFVGLDVTADGVLLAERSGALYSLDRSSGNALWKQETLLRREPTSVVVSGSRAVVADVEGWLHWVNPQTGDTVARARVGRDPVRAAPVALADGTVVAVTNEGRLAAFRVQE